MAEMREKHGKELAKQKEAMVILCFGGTGELDNKIDKRAHGTWGNHPKNDIEWFTYILDYDIVCWLVDLCLFSAFDLGITMPLRH